jgi:hypothetical protein
MWTLEEIDPSKAAPARVNEAVHRMLEARSACTNGDFLRGLALYRKAEVLARGGDSPELGEAAR